ncbi:MAG: SurA N-terminal domain-containing protein [Tabrizicola sp.]|uniref:peptidyl-prolyl cis-trans isomerase n=1 Tax=Tabrizicola sp. TaxID=2005166 RepID=UPI002AB84A89|nr:peptidyl-prolyl cis-trans isomerase [Tabrizicola sp.]MDZ4087275.1 SurA N-terminal domain-containing protein [Tabrizicola sp.]
MAKTPTEDGKRPRSTVKEVAVWTMLGMLILGLGGFGVTSFSGGVTKVGSVGDIDITTDDYARALQTQVAAFGQQFGQQLSMQEALAFGIDKQVLQDVLTRAALDNEAQRVGVSVGDDVVATEIMGMDAFKGVSGSFERETYRFALERNNLSETEFETNLRRDISRELLQGAVAGGFAAPAALTDTLYAWVGERRGFSMLRLTEGDLTAPPAEPTEAELQAHYDANLDRFTRPEAKRVTYAALLPEAIAKDQPVDDAMLQKMYQDRIAEFVIPERRILERLVYPDQAAAEAAKAKFDAGTTFEDLVAERGLTLDAIDMGDVSLDELGAAGEPIFATAEGQVAGPLDSDLGPALYRVVSVLAAEETTFDEARETLAIEIQTDAARRLIADQVEAIDDLLAGGATLEDLAKEMGLALATLDHVPGQQGQDSIEGYPAFRAAADAVQEGDFPEAIVLEDGGVVALRLDEIVAAAPIPFDEAKDQVTEDWRRDAVAKALTARGAEIKAALDGGAAIGSFGIVDVTPETDRSGFVADTPETLLEDVFKMTEGEARVIEADGFIAVVKLDRILPAATEGEDAEGMRAALAAQARQAIAQDAFAAFTNALTAEAGISLDQAAINAVHASLP